MRRLGYLTILLLTSCAPLKPAPPSLPVGRTRTVDQLVIHSDFPLPEQHRMLDELRALREQVSRRLELPVTEEPIHVYLFKSGSRYRAFLKQHFPDYPMRRAFFVETDTRLAVYAHWGDHVAVDLRHEVCHGYLHAAAGHLPLWIDEGLAEYFEVSPGRGGVNRPHVRLLEEKLREGWRPDLARLESLDTPEAMRQLDYAESWAWVHLLLETSGARRSALHGYLDSLRRRDRGDVLSKSLDELSFDPTRDLVEHIRALRE
jgi:hypothetical protein